MKSIPTYFAIGFFCCLIVACTKQESDSTPLAARMWQLERAVFGEGFNGEYPREEPLATSGLYAAVDGNAAILRSQEESLVKHQGEIAGNAAGLTEHSRIINALNDRLAALDGKHVAAPAPPAALARRVVLFSGPFCEPCHKMIAELETYFAIGGAPGWSIGPGPENQIQTVDSACIDSLPLMKLCSCKAGQALPYFVLLIDGKPYKLQIDGKSVTTGVVACDVFCNAAGRYVK